MTIDDDLTPIILREEVMKEYNKLISLINNHDTAKEYSYVLLGRKCLLAEESCYLIDKIVDCNTVSEIEDLSSRETHIDNEKLNIVIQEAIRNGYNFISLGHTHPIISEEERKNTVVNYLSREVKDSSFIREAGLNLSLQDFISYESLYQFFLNNPNIRTFQTVIMYNGEIAMISKQNGDLKRFSVIMGTNGEAIYVSTKEEMKETRCSL